MPAVIAHAGPVPALALAVAAAWGLTAAMRPGGLSARSILALAGALVAVTALSPPVEHAAEHGTAPHMIQHILLVSVASPLLALAPHPAPGSVPLAVRRRAGALTRVARRSAPLVLLAATAAYVAAVALWHVPGPYDAAVRSAPVHAAEHATLLGGGVALWAAVRLNTRRHPMTCIVALFVTAVTGAAIGALLTFAAEPHYAQAALAPDPLADQQIAGLIMWVPGGVVPVTGAALVARHALLERPPVGRPALAR